jgi:hypothetical protein
MLRTRFKYGGDGLFLPLYLLISSLFHISLLVSGRLFARTGDPIAQDYPFKHLYASALKNLELPLWNPYEFIGLPLMGNLQVGTLYPFNLLLYGLFAPDTAWNVSYVLHFALAAYFAFLYVRLLGAGRTASFAGGLVFGFSGYITASSGHIMITSAATYLPLVMYLLERLRRERRVEHALLLSLAVAVQMLAGNFQICVYTYLVAALYGAASLLRLPREDRSRFLLLGALGFLAGVALYLPQLVSTLDLSRASYMRMRSIFTGYEYFSTFHFYLVEFPSLWLPNLFDTWGPQDQAFPRLRTLIIVLAGVTFLLGARKSGHVLFWGAVAAAALLLASGPSHRRNIPLSVPPSPLRPCCHPGLPRQAGIPEPRKAARGNLPGKSRGIHAASLSCRIRRSPGRKRTLAEKPSRGGLPPGSLPGLCLRVPRHYRRDGETAAG